MLRFHTTGREGVYHLEGRGVDHRDIMGSTVRDIHQFAMLGHRRTQLPVVRVDIVEPQRRGHSR